MTLSEKLERWDRKSVHVLEALYQSECQSKDFINKLIHAVAEQRSSDAATWLLKHHIDDHGKFDPKQVKQLYSLCLSLVSWQSKLHFLQMLDGLPIKYADQTALEHFLRTCLSDNNKFVRAWSYNGLHLFANHYPEYREEVTGFFELAIQDESASVKARIRKSMGKGFN